MWSRCGPAAARIDAPWDVANADAFVGLMTGTVVGTLIPVTVLQTSAGDELAGTVRSVRGTPRSCAVWAPR